jgi:hypothetical protein
MGYFSEDMSLGYLFNQRVFEIAFTKKHTCILREARKMIF